MRAAIEVGTACGIPVSEPALLQETNNTVVWLRPSPVVAKVATRPDSKLDVRLEHAVGSELAALGADIAVPLPGLEPVEHLPTGFVVTLWVRLERVDAEAADRSLSSSLVALHGALTRTRTKLPSFRVELMRARLALDDDTFMSALAPTDRTFLRPVYDGGLAELDGVDLDRQRLHGEPHYGNRVTTAQGVRWIDFESCCVGPLEWDLAFQSAEVIATFSDVDRDLLRRLRRLNSARVATWCWGTARFPECGGTVSATSKPSGQRRTAPLTLALEPIAVPAELGPTVGGRHLPSLSTPRPLPPFGGPSSSAQQASTPHRVGSAVGAARNNPWRPTCRGRETVGVLARLRTHEVALVDGLVRLRPFTEADWETAAVWQADPRVLWFSEGGFVDGRPLAETQGIYRGVSQAADVFVIERDGVPVGDGWVQAMNLPRITARFTGLRTARIDLQLAYEVWGEGLGTRAIRLMTDHAFASGYDLVFAVDIADFNQRSRRAFLRCGYVPWRRVAQPPGAKSAYVHDLVCRPALFYGTAPLQEHPGSDRIRAADAPFGAAIVVYRRTPELEVLLLHRAAGGPDHEGDWAWTPPAGARFPAEPIDDCAARELHEEIGVELSPRPVAVDEATGWAIYVSEVPPAVPIQLDAEHDRYEWQPVAAAVGRCLPVSVGESVDRAMAGLR